MKRFSFGGFVKKEQYGARFNFIKEIGIYHIYEISHETQRGATFEP